MPKLASGTPIFIQTKDRADFESLRGVSFLSDSFDICEADLEPVPSGSVIFLDDYSRKWASRQKVEQFYNIVDFHLR